MKKLTSSLLVFFVLSLEIFGQVQGKSFSDKFNTYSVPQVAIGGGYTETFTITSNSALPIDSFTINVWNQAGDRWDVHFRIIREGFEDAEGFIAIINPGVIIPNGSIKVILWDQSSVPLVGHAALIIPKRADSKDSLSVQVEYTLTTPAGSIIGQAAVLPAISSVSLNFHANRYTDKNKNTFRTGIAIANSPGFESVNVNCTAYNGSGAPLASTNFILPSVGQIAKFVDEMIPTLPANWAGGLIHCDASRPVGGLTLEFILNANGDPVFSTGTTF